MEEKKYKVVVVKESLFVGILLGGGGKIPSKKLQNTLNEYASDGWNLEFMITDKRLFRSSVVITLSKTK